MESEDLGRAENGFKRFEKCDSRPPSVYDNYGENGSGDGYHHNRNPDECLVDEEACPDGEKNPTQEYLLKTTVPQNLAAMNIAERHTPTRNSLRHSRMIVMNRSGQVRRTHAVPIIRWHKFATVLMSLQVVLGIAICSLAVWLLIWSPNLPRRDNPHWSGLPLLASGTVGLLLLCCFRSSRPRTLRGYLIDGFKMFSGLLSLVAGAACLTAAVFALIHLVTLSAMACESSSPLNHACVCSSGANATHPVRSYHYVDLTCEDVGRPLVLWLVASCVANTLAGLVSLLYIYLYCSNRYGYIYSKVRSKDIEMVELRK